MSSGISESHPPHVLSSQAQRAPPPPWWKPPRLGRNATSSSPVNPPPKPPTATPHPAPSRPGDRVGISQATADVRVCGAAPARQDKGVSGMRERTHVDVCRCRVRVGGAGGAWTRTGGGQGLTGCVSPSGRWVSARVWGEVGGGRDGTAYGSMGEPQKCPRGSAELSLA